MVTGGQREVLVGAARFETRAPLLSKQVPQDSIADNRLFSCKSRRLRAPATNLFLVQPGDMRSCTTWAQALAKWALSWMPLHS